jgi:hypothetical protein
MTSWMRWNRCLRPRTLAMLAEGVGSARQRSHLARCARCAARLATVLHARDVAAAVLRDATLYPTIDRGARTARAHDIVGWVAPVAAAASLAVVLVAGMRAPSMHPADRGSAGDAAPSPAFSLDDVSEGAFAVDDTSVWLEADVDTARWEAALRGERPCEEQGIDANDPRCN